MLNCMHIKEMPILLIFLIVLNHLPSEFTIDTKNLQTTKQTVFSDIKCYINKNNQ